MTGTPSIDKVPQHTARADKKPPHPDRGEGAWHYRNFEKFQHFDNALEPVSRLSVKIIADQSTTVEVSVMSTDGTQV